MRADKLEFNISYSDSAYPDNASKLRVFCYMKNGGYAFGDEFEDKYSAIFDSNRTAKYSGYGTITIQLLDAEENLINSANVVCKIIESNSTTPFVVSPDFAQESKQEVQAIVDNGKSQIVEATKEAKEKIDSWSDQTSRFAKNESDITDLQLFKANTGALHFNGGSLVVGASGTTDSMPSTFSWCRTIKISQEQWSNIATGTYFDGNAGSGIGFSFFKASNGNIGLKYSGNGFTTGNIFFSTEQRNLLLDGNVHTLVVICANETLKLYIDNKLIIDKLVSGATSIPQTKLRYQIDKFTGQYSRICNFNFDVTSEDAPYTIADYQQGKPIPPNLLNGTDTLLALEDYTIANGTSGSKIIFDYSGNGNDATITGDVKGDNDNRIAKLVNFILER